MVIIYWGEQSQEVEQMEQVEVSTYQLMCVNIEGYGYNLKMVLGGFFGCFAVRFSVLGVNKLG